MEIGPGFGQYLIRALHMGGFQKYLAVDISETSVRKCLSYLRYRGVPKQAYEVKKQDFFQFDCTKQFDFIVMGEVLEHVEQPLKMMQKIYSLLKAGGRAFVTTVMNSPAVDHIYLFRNKQEVLDLAGAAGFTVDDCLCAAAGNMSVEAAQTRHLSVNIAMILRKQPRNCTKGKTGF